VGVRGTEVDALLLARELIGKGWPVAALSLQAEDESVDVDELPPAMSGDELARRAEAAGDDPVRRTA
jgi:hypothetical protein